MSRQRPQLQGRVAIIKTIRQLAHRRSVWDVWRDWLEMCALSLRNAVDRDAGWQEREDRYLAVVKGYDRDEVESLCRCFADLVDAMTVEPGDVLGSIFMELELGNANMGQFFTPYEVCKMMASMTLADGKAQQAIERRGYVTLQEPACGGGAMIIAMAEEMRRLGMNPQQQLHVTAVDLDIKAVHMAYIQLVLLHIPAVIVYGNALTLEERDHWYTPAHILGGWSWRLRAGHNEKSGAQFPDNETMPDSAPANDNTPTEVPMVSQEQVAVGQSFSLF